MEELLENILFEAIEMGITDLHFKSQVEPIIYARLNGEILEFKSFKIDIYIRLIGYLKYKSHLDFNQLTKPQTGSFQMTIQDHVYYFRLSYLPSNEDIHLVLRILNHTNKITFSQLTTNSNDLDFFRKILEKESGLIIVCGPTGSGKSTTLHSFLDKLLLENNKNILTIEDPIEIYQKGLIQLQVNHNMGLSFETILEQVLRHDPDIIMIGELRNEDSAKIAMNLSLTGHLVMTTLHASDGISAIRRLKKLKVNEDDLTQVILGIITQRLFYHTNTKRPFVVFEILDLNTIHSYLKGQQTTFVPLIEKIKQYYMEGWISEKDYRKYS